MTEYVYFVQQGEVGPIKIGWSRSVRQRLAAIQSGNPEPLHCLGVIAGGIGDEHALHRRFKRHHIHGEWFRPVPELMEYIAAHATPFDAQLESVRVPFDQRFWISEEGRQAHRRGMAIWNEKRKRRLKAAQRRMRAEMLAEIRAGTSL